MNLHYEPSPEQKAVIDHPLTPLRVVAGAGSGKTGTMAMRLAHFVASGQVEPEAALGITFTRKAAGELADRLRSHLPDLAAEGREVEVTTYHGFALSLIREFGPLVGIDREARVVTASIARQLLRWALTEVAPLDLDLRRPSAVIDGVASLTARLGDHLRTPGELFEYPGEGPVAAERRALAQVAAAYQRSKAEFGVLDFADLVRSAHRLVVEHPLVAERVRDRYGLALLDEYQDTNPAQRELLRAIFGGGFPVTAVGDTDQTIFEFQGASADNFDGFPTHFPRADGTPAPTLGLSVTWRNDRAIVDAANRVRERMQSPGPLDRLMDRPGSGPGSVDARWFRTREDEARHLAEKVLALHDEGLPWRQMAVLFRKHRQMASIRDALVAAEVPVEVTSMGGLLEVPEVVDLHAWLRLLARPDDAVAVARILTGARHRLGLADLAAVARMRRRPADGVGDAPGWALLEAVDDLTEGSEISTSGMKKIDRFRQTYRSLVTEAQGLGHGDLCRAVLDATEVWPEVEALSDAARLSTRLNLFRFLDLAETWSPVLGPPTLTAFLDHLDRLAEDDARQDLDTARISGEDAVPLMTVHQAKGLEWDAVFLPALEKDVFPAKVVSLENPEKDPSVLPGGLRLDGDDGESDEDRLKMRHAEQEWRTAYVAVTRSRSLLAASGAFWTGGAEHRLPSPLFELLSGVAGPDPLSCTEPGERPEGFSQEPVAPTPDPLFPNGPAMALATVAADASAARAMAVEKGVGDAYDRRLTELLDAFDRLPQPAPAEPPPPPLSVSVTGLMTLASCPRRFRWSEVERLPRHFGIAARRGVEVHRRIEAHNRGTIAFDEIDPRFDESSPEPEPAAISAYEVFLESRFATRRPALVEAAFDLAVGTTRVVGRIDAVYEWDDRREIVDFKSGRAGDDPARVVQLEAYSVAVNDAGLFPEPADRLVATLAYLGGGGLEEYTEVVDDQRLEAARTHLAELVERAAGDDHPPAPSDACHRCDFLHLCPEGRARMGR